MSVKNCIFGTMELAELVLNGYKVIAIPLADGVPGALGIVSHRSRRRGDDREHYHCCH